MDRFLYISMSGAKETLRAQTVNNHHLANASTNGFRADLSAFQSRAVAGSGYASRTYATNATIGWDSSRRWGLIPAIMNTACAIITTP
jgi:flagellar basal-body rod protein FlgF